MPSTTRRFSPSPGRFPYLGGTLAAVIATLLFAPAVHAQLGTFADSQPYWIGPIGGAGVEILSGQIWIDVNGNDLSDMGIDTFHPIPSGLASGWDFRLSPSRRVMIAFTSNGQPCPQVTSIRLYTVPAMNGAALVQLGSQQQLPRCIGDVGFKDDAMASVRTGFFRATPDPISGTADILWWNLETGDAATSPFPFDAGFGFVQFAPTGEMAWVQHGLGAPAGTKYSLVTLCPPSPGPASQPGLTNQTQVLSATVEDGTSERVVVARDPSDQVVQTYTFTDCALPPPTTGACCVPGGGCIDGTTQTECEMSYGGTWNGTQSACQTANCPQPPTILLAVSKTGPTSAVNGGNLTYVLTARNDGTLGAENVAVSDSIPLGVSFLSASGDGAYNNFTRKATWALGALGPGAQRACTLMVAAPCSGTSTENQRYFVSASGVGTIPGAPVVTTPLTPSPTTPLTIVLDSQALAPMPLQTGDHTQHTVQLTNTLAVPREGVRMLFGGGNASDIVQIVDDGGGTLTSNFGQYTWEGTIGPNATVQIVWETAIRECRPAVAAVEQMNRGVLIVLTSRCSQNLGFAFPTQSFPVAASPFTMRLDSPSHGPAQTPTSPGATPIIVARPGATIDFDLSFVYSSGTTAPACGVTFTFPYGLDPAADPPFIGPPPSGSNWDALSRTFTWSGQPAPNDSVVLSFQGTLSSEGCLTNVSAFGSHGSCVNDLQAQVGVIGVPEPPPGGYLVGLDSNSGLWTYQDGAAQWQSLMCGSFQQLYGVGRTPDGTLWVTGFPNFQLNPETLEFGLLPDSILTNMDMDYVFDAAGDPGDSSVIFSGYKSGVGLRVRRYNPRTGAVSFLVNDTAPQTFGPGQSVVVSADGTIGVQSQFSILVIDPLNPGAYQVMDDVSLDDFAGLSLDTDDNYLTVESGVTGRHLLKLDRMSGVFTPLVDLAPFFSPTEYMNAVETAPNLDVYAGAQYGGFVAVRRASGSSVDLPPTGPQFADLLYVGGSNVGVPDPTHSRTPDAVELSAAFPNPFFGTTSVRFGLPRRGAATLEIYDILGRRVRTLASGERDAGTYTVTWDGRDDAGGRLGAGLYFVRLAAGADVRRGKVVLSR